MTKGFLYTCLILGLLLPYGLFAQSNPPLGVDGGSLPPTTKEVVSVSAWMDEATATDNPLAGENIFTYPVLLECGQELNGLSAPEGARIVIPLEMSGDKLRMTLRMSGGTGDADMYLSYAEVPGRYSYQYRPYVNGL